MLSAKQKGFTFVELVILLAIIGILTAIAIPAFQDYRAGNHRNRDYQDNLPAGGEVLCVDGQRIFQNADGQMAVLKGGCFNN